MPFYQDILEVPFFKQVARLRIRQGFHRTLDMNHCTVKYVNRYGQQISGSFSANRAMKGGSCRVLAWRRSSNVLSVVNPTV
ncbi:hypothetical protein P389DRAFT_54027 [Cystobasidium minutum MCA 4210]|uniref:uncharacterized protein n=1 Tax=Cystobasidium minutum MCA 4210 TaxID=1397322 RepID=UPI0034CEB892|eukprot:jgi/Rhomi1/54027/CE54026_109